MSSHPLVRRTLRVLFTAVFPLLPGTLTAAEPVTWPALPDLVRQNAPGLVSARREVEEIHARAAAAGWPSESELSVEFKPALASGGEGSVQAEYARTLHRPARLRSERDAALAQLPVLEARLRERETESIAEARAAAVRLLLADRRLELVNRQETGARALADLLALRAAGGEASLLDSAQAAFDAGLLTVRRAQIEATRAEAEQTLRSLLAWPDDRPFAFKATLADLGAEPGPADADPVSGAGETARAEAALAEAESAREREAARPENRVGFLAEFERAEDAPDGIGNEAFAGFAFTRPLAVPGKAEAAARESGLRALRLREDAARHDAAARREAEAARAVMRAQAAAFLAADAEPARLAAEQEELAQRLMRAGQGDLTAVLRARAQRLALEEARLDALEAHHLARVRLYAALRR